MKPIIKIFLILFILIVIFLSLIGLSTKTIEIIPTDTGIEVRTTTSFFYPFESEDNYYIPNVKRAIITTLGNEEYDEYKEGDNVKCNVKLESFDEYAKISVSDYSSDYDFQKQLCDNINASIKKRTRFTYTTRPYAEFIFKFLPVIIFIFSPALIKLFFIFRPLFQDKKEPSKPIRFKLQETGEEKPKETLLPKKEDKKYREINDSVMKK